MAMETFGLINLLKSALFAQPQEEKSDEMKAQNPAPTGQTAQTEPQFGPEPDDRPNAFLDLMARHERIAKGAKQSAQSPRSNANLNAKNK